MKQATTVLQFSLQSLFWLITYVAASLGLWTGIHNATGMNALKIGLHLGWTGLALCIPFLVGYVTRLIPRCKHCAVYWLELGIYCQLGMAAYDMICNLRLGLASQESFLTVWVYLLWTLWFLGVPLLCLEWKNFWRNSHWIKLGMCVCVLDMALFTLYFFQGMTDKIINATQF
jgi:hypothetical protein